jgi:hypothetical protein
VLPRREVLGACLSVEAFDESAAPLLTQLQSKWDMTGRCAGGCGTCISASVAPPCNLERADMKRGGEGCSAGAGGGGRTGEVDPTLSIITCCSNKSEVARSRDCTACSAAQNEHYVEQRGPACDLLHQQLLIEALP